MAGDFSISWDVSSCSFIAIKCTGVCFNNHILCISILIYGQSKETDCCLAKRNFGVTQKTPSSPESQKQGPGKRGHYTWEEGPLPQSLGNPQNQNHGHLPFFLSLKSGLSTQTTRQDSLRATSNQGSKESSCGASNGKCRPETLSLSASGLSPIILHHKAREMFSRITWIMSPPPQPYLCLILSTVSHVLGVKIKPHRGQNSAYPAGPLSVAHLLSQNCLILGCSQIPKTFSLEAWCCPAPESNKSKRKDFRTRHISV